MCVFVLDHHLLCLPCPQGHCLLAEPCYPLAAGALGSNFWPVSSPSGESDLRHQERLCQSEAMLQETWGRRGDWCCQGREAERRKPQAYPGLGHSPEGDGKQPASFNSVQWVPSRESALGCWGTQREPTAFYSEGNPGRLPEERLMSQNNLENE